MIEKIPFKLEKWLENKNLRVIGEDWGEVNVMTKSLEYLMRPKSPLYFAIQVPKFHEGEHIKYKGQVYKITEVTDYGYTVNAIPPYLDGEICLEIGFAAESAITLSSIDTTEFVAELANFASAAVFNSVETKHPIKKFAQEYSEHLLNTAKKIVFAGQVAMSISDYKDAEKRAFERGVKEGYEKGVKSAKELIPTWKVADRDLFTDTIDFAVKYTHDGGDNPDYDTIEVTNRVMKGEEYFDLYDLEKLSLKKH